MTAIKTATTRKSGTTSIRKADGRKLDMAPVTGIVMGVLAGFTDEMVALVNFEGNPEKNAVSARVLAHVCRNDIGKMVALQFERGHIGQPVIMGLLHCSAGQTVMGQPTTSPSRSNTPLQFTGNGDEVTLVANRKLTLQCGRASITLDVDGNIELRGQNLLSRAAGQNRIKGSSVSVN